MSDRPSGIYKHNRKRGLADEIFDIVDANSDRMQEMDYITLANACKRVFALEKRANRKGVTLSTPSSEEDEGEDDEADHEDWPARAVVEHHALSEPTTIADIMTDHALEVVGHASGDRLIVTETREGPDSQQWMTMALRNHGRPNSVAPHRATPSNIIARPQRYIDPAAIVVLTHPLSRPSERKLAWYVRTGMSTLIPLHPQTMKQILLAMARDPVLCESVMVKEFAAGIDECPLCVPRISNGYATHIGNMPPPYHST